ncbi:hypothetical protein AB8810_04570 [Xanthomonas sp. NCPPB 3005]|uniref:hypothetical protein n=1 Tax=Xanthomonas sp. NCPPB 3005 TaxID=3240913 RepID=UPI00355A3A8F
MAKTTTADNKSVTFIGILRKSHRHPKTAILQSRSCLIESSSLIFTIRVWLLDPLGAMTLPRSVPAWRHFRELAYRRISLDHTAEANELEVFPVQRGSAQKLPIAVVIMVDLTDGLQSFENLPGGEHT